MKAIVKEISNQEEELEDTDTDDSIEEETDSGENDEETKNHQTNVPTRSKFFKKGNFSKKRGKQRSEKKIPDLQKYIAIIQTPMELDTA